MCAVGEPAVGREFDDVGEGGRDAVFGFPQCEAAQPGVSIATPPFGSTTSSRAVVVCRPFPSSRTSPVDNAKVPAPKAFVSVDLPAPEGPIIATVRPSLA